MHNCKATRERLAELEEVEAAELSDCADCRAEFNSLNAMLRLTTRLSETAAPAESYWTGYHARLRQRIEEEFHAKTQRGKGHPASFLAPLRLCVKTTVAIPVPLALAIFIAFVALTVLAVRGARRPEPPSPVVVHVPVEVPVVQEKLVTRVVYKERRSSAKPAKRSTNNPQVESTFARFKPTDDVKLTVIKGGFQNEK